MALAGDANKYPEKLYRNFSCCQSCLSRDLKAIEFEI